MNRITPEKRNQLIMVGLVILAVIAGLYFGLIRYQQQKFRELVVKKDTANTKLAQIADTKTSGGKIETELAEVSDQLAVKETDMASDDLYAWMVNFIRKFK